MPEGDFKIPEKPEGLRGFKNSKEARKEILNFFKEIQSIPFPPSIFKRDGSGNEETILYLNSLAERITFSVDNNYFLNASIYFDNGKHFWENTPPQANSSGKLDTFTTVKFLLERLLTRIRIAIEDGEFEDEEMVADEIEELQFGESKSFYSLSDAKVTTIDFIKSLRENLKSESESSGGGVSVTTQTAEKPRYFRDGFYFAPTKKGVRVWIYVEEDSSLESDTPEQKLYSLEAYGNNRLDALESLLIVIAGKLGELSQ